MHGVNGHTPGHDDASDIAEDVVFTRYPILGFSYYAGDIAGAAQVVIDRALSGAGGYGCLTGVHGVTTARRDAAHYAALKGAWLNFPDGAPIAWRQRMAGSRSARRVGGPDLMPEVISAGQRRGVRHYLLGSTPETLEQLVHVIQGRYPRATIVGSMSPPFRELDSDEEKQMLAEVRATEPHIVWVGLGAPKQDLWMHRYSARLAPSLCMGVGAAFDFVAGKKQRAPEWMRHSGLEWVHRVSQEPRRLAPRYLQSNSRFVADNTRDAIDRILHRDGSAR
jgi:N-acetylglucosaminyldiphosphoundecaprenol N-acetyl-beta-D-mannosaminyltransferase